MTPNPTTLKIIAGWVTRLADVTAHRDKKPTVEAVAAYAAILGQSYPSSAFTAESLAHVVSGQEWFPAAATILASLREWWTDHKPAGAPMIADGRPLPQGWEDMDQNWVSFYNKRQGEISALDDRRKADFQRDRLESLIRQQSPRAAEFLGFARRAPSISFEERERIAATLAGAVEATDLNAALAPARRPRADVTLTGEQFAQARADAALGRRR